MPAHIHAENMRLYYEDALETERPNKLWQFKASTDDDWFNFHKDDIASPPWIPGYQYRRKPKTIRIGEYDVPEPLRVGIKKNDVYFIADIIAGIPSRNQWCNDSSDLKWIKAGLCHLEEKSAQTHLDALLSFTKKD